MLVMFFSVFYNTVWICGVAKKRITCAIDKCVGFNQNSKIYYNIRINIKRGVT